MKKRQTVLNRIFPKECAGCGTIGEYLCKKCKKNLIPHPEICPVCHKYSKDFMVCLDCLQNKEIYYRGLLIGFRYEGELKKLILGLKYYHYKDISDFLVLRIKLLIECNEYLKRNNDIIISSIPAHRIRKYFIKGYNQSEILAEKLSYYTGYKYLNLGKKRKYTFSQTKLNKEKRISNLSGSFIYSKDKNLRGKETILIIDDITTTGSTINEMAKEIKKKYPETEIFGVVLGRHS